MREIGAYFEIRDSRVWNRSFSWCVSVHLYKILLTLRGVII